MGHYLKCTHCGFSNLAPDGTCHNCGRANNIKLSSEFGTVSDIEARRINEYRVKLIHAVNAFDYQEISDFSNEILGILPDDFLANYYQAYASRIFYDDSNYVDFLLNADFSYATEENIAEVLKHMIVTCSLRYNKYVMEFIGKAFEDPSIQNRWYQLLAKETKRKEQELVIDENKRDAFILYADKDKDLAYDILELLEDEQLKCFIAPRDLGHNPKTRYDDIALGIKNSKCFLIVGSKNFLDSDECVKEAQYAQRINKNLIYFEIDEYAHKQFSYSFKHINTIDAVIDQYGKFEQLLLCVQMNVTENEETRKELKEELDEIIHRDELSDELYRKEQRERIAKMEQALANISKDETSVAADLEYTQSLKNCLGAIACEDFPNAKTYLVDCERNYPNHICTTIVNLAYLLRRIYQPNANVDALLSQIKELNTNIVQNVEVISDDETAIYVMLKDDNIYGLLLTLFYTLGDETRTSFIQNIINYENITEEPVFQAVLDFLLQEGYNRIIYRLVSRLEYKDKKLTLTKILKNFKDGDAKLDLVEILLKADAYNITDSKLVEDYLKNSLDKVSTKVQVVLIASKKQIIMDSEFLIRYVLFSANDTKYVEPVFELLASDISYDQFMLILDFVLTGKCKNDLIGLKIISVLIDKKLPYDFDYRAMNEFLRKPYFTLDSKIEMLEKLCEFNISRKSYDNIMNYYLCFNQSSVEERIKVLEVLFKNVQDIPITALERYVITSNYDGDQKPLVVQMLLDLNMNPLYFSTILANYLRKNNDSPGVMKRVVLQLCNRKLTLGTQEFIDYIKDQRIDGNVIRILVENGQAVKPECLEYYLLRLNDSYPFDEVIFQSLYIKNIKLSGKAFANFLMYAKLDKKYDYFIEFSCHLLDPLGDISVEIPFAQDYISINVPQAYLLKNKDDDKMSERILRSFFEANLNINQDIRIGAKAVRFKKYLEGVKGFIDKHMEFCCKVSGL